MNSSFWHKNKIWLAKFRERFIIQKFKASKKLIKIEKDIWISKSSGAFKMKFYASKYVNLGI